MDFRKVILGLTIAILMGCETSEITMSKMYLKEITDPTCYTDQFEYEGERLISYKRLFGEREATVTKFIYQSNRLMTIETKSDNGQDYTIELSYGANGLRERENRTLKQDNEVKNLTTVDFFYDEHKNLKSKHISYTDPNFFSSETEFEWVNGNIVKRNYFYFDNQGTRHYISSDKLLFDNKRNYTNQDLTFIYTGLYDEAVLSKNNVISNPNKYEYNNSGYPIKFKYTIDNKDYPVLMKYE
jgi:hypothetical protein